MDRTHFINPPKKRIKNKGSTALARFDNQKLFSLYEYDSFSIVAAICQMLYLKTGTTRQWRCAASGVLCFTKDYKKKAYLLRMYCLEKRKCIWEEPLNKDFMPELDASKSFLMRLQGRDSNYMIKFEHHDEAESFHYYLQKYYRQEDEVKSEVMQHEIVEKLVFEVPDNLFSQHHISDETLQLIKGTGFDPSSMKVEEIIFARDFIEKFMLSLKKQPISDKENIPVNVLRAAINAPSLPRCSAHSTRIPIAPNVVPNFRKVPIPPVLSPSNNETLLQQLQRGTTLRHVENHLLPENKVKRQENSTVETIADALAKALEARRHQIERADSVENVAETQDWD